MSIATTRKPGSAVLDSPLIICDRTRLRAVYLKSGLRENPRGFASCLHQFVGVPRAPVSWFAPGFSRWGTSPPGTSLRSAPSIPRLSLRSKRACDFLLAKPASTGRCLTAPHEAISPLRSPNTGAATIEFFHVAGWRRSPRGLE